MRVSSAQTWWARSWLDVAILTLIISSVVVPDLSELSSDQGKFVKKYILENFGFEHCLKKGYFGSISSLIG